MELYRKIVLTAILSVWCLMTSAHHVKGIVRSINNTAIENVSVTALLSDRQQTTFTDAKGAFSIEVPDNVRKIKVTFVHVSFESKEVELSTDSLHNVFLVPQEHSLEEVVIKSDWIYKKDGNSIVDVKQIPHAEKLRADQVLSRIPGIVKTNGSSYSLNGKPATIFINGIKQNISANSLEAFLSSLPANAISSVELVDVNSGKYSATIEAVIDIKTNPNMPIGYSFQSYAYSSFFPKGLENYGGHVFYMAKVGRILHQHTLSYSNNRIYSIQSDSLLINGNRMLHNEGFKRGRINVLTYRGAMTYQYDNGNRLVLNAFVYDDFGKIKADWASKQANNHREIKDRNDLYHMALAYQIPSSQKKFNGNMALAISYGGQHSVTDYFDASNTRYGKADLDMEGWMRTLSANFNTEIRKWHFSYGLQFDYNNAWDRTIYEYTHQSYKNASPFTGSEFLSELYAQARYRVNNHLSLRAGMRLENTHYQYNLDNKEATHDYTDFFPTLLLYYNTNNYNLTAGFISSISRPNYQWLFPGERKTNDYVYFSGNPEIRPTKTYRFLVNNTLFKYAQFNLSYSLTEDYINNLYVKRGDILVQSKDNIARLQAFRVNMVLPFAFFNRKLTGQIQANASYNTLRNFKNGFVAPTNRATNYWLHSYNAVINYSPTSRLNISLFGNVAPKQNTTLYSTQRNMNWDVEVYYSFLKNENLTLSLGGYNLFARDAMTTNYFLNNSYHSTFENNGPTFQVSLKLKLNKGQKVIEEYKDYIPDVSRMR